jgi:flagellar hook-length control protein FliK
VATTAAAPVAGAAAPAQALVEVAASPALEGWRLEAEPGVRTSAAEAAAASRPMPPAQHIVAQLTVAIQRTPGERVEIRLDPPELGRVQIELSSRDGVLHATVTAERPEVHDLMRRHAEMLRQELAAAGHTGVRLEFATGSGQGEGGREAEDPRQVTTRERDAAGPAASAPVENPIDRRPRRAGERLDIRL